MAKGNRRKRQYNDLQNTTQKKTIQWSKETEEKDNTMISLYCLFLLFPLTIVLSFSSVSFDHCIVFFCVMFCILLFVLWSKETEEKDNTMVKGNRRKRQYNDLQNITQKKTIQWSKETEEKDKQ
jgi:Ca2+/Na+ antiporter